MNIEESVSLIKEGPGGSRKKMHVTSQGRDNYYLDVFSYKDIKNLNLPDQKVLLSNLWRTEENVMIYSKTGDGKSWLSLSIATCISGKGKMAFNFLLMLLFFGQISCPFFTLLLSFSHIV